MIGERQSRGLNNTRELGGERPAITHHGSYCDWISMACSSDFAPISCSKARVASSKDWPDRYFVPGEVRGYCTIGAPSRVGGDGAMVSGAGGL